MLRQGGVFFDFGGRIQTGTTDSLNSDRLNSEMPTALPSYRCYFLLGTLWACLLTTATADESSRQQQFQDQLLPLLRTFCYDCHGAEDGEGGLSLEVDDTPLKLLKGRKHWMRAKAQVQLGTMPPADADPMDPSTRQRMVSLIDDLANAVDCVRLSLIHI